MPGCQVLATKVCAWCGTGTVTITTATPMRQRATKRFCGRPCSNAAMGITNTPEHFQRMNEASHVSRKQKAQARAVALMKGLPVATAARAIYERAYAAGWHRGKLAGIALERGRLTRAYERARKLAS